MYLKKISVEKVTFQYTTKSWKSKEYILPYFNEDYVILTPKDMLTRDENWISRPNMLQSYKEICGSLPDEALRSQLNAYLEDVLPKNAKHQEYIEAINKVITRYPAFIEYYIKHKEETGEEAVIYSEKKVIDTEKEFIQQVKYFTEWLKESTDFYSKPKTSLEESLDRILYLKQVIEHNDGYRVFYLDGEPVGTERDLQLIFRLTWFETSLDVNSEVNNGRGPVDYKVSNGKKDSTLVEFKLASNSKLKRNLEKQVEIYGKSNCTNNKIKVIMYFTKEEMTLVDAILIDLGIKDDKYIVLIDARSDNKISASKA
jgi:hypothetical protein